MSDFLKAEQLSSNKWRILSIPFGGPFKGGRDLDGERFTPETDIKADWFDRRPTIWHHGQDRTLKDTLIGYETDLTKDEEGWWGTLWLNRSNSYWAMVDKLLRAGKAFGSSGTMPHLVKRRGDEITVWPHVEQTLTTTPVNPFARVEAVKALGHLTSAGIVLDDAVKAAIGADLDPDDLLLGGDPFGDLPAGGDDGTLAALKALRDQLVGLRNL